GDGRLKPTICAPGVNIQSALNDRDLGTNNSGETQMSGTSMATPTTSGTLALVRQYFTEGWYPSGTKSGSDSLTPTAALMKSVLMVGAVEISGAGSDFKNEGVYPNNSQGWGRVTLENSLYFNGDPSRLWIKDERGGVQTGDNITVKVQVKSAGVPLKIILVWTDAPGAIYSNPSIVNDLDLMVTGPNGTYFGNRFAGKNPGHSVKGGSFDRVNVEEGVLLPDAANGLIPGEYTINVIGLNVPTGPQPFALAVVGDIEGQATVASVTITPPAASVEVTKSAQFQARALDGAGNDVPGAKFAYTVTPATLGNASDLGNGSVSFTAGTKTGTGVLTAAAGGMMANASITVTAGPIVTLTVDPATISMAVKGTAPVRAIGKDQHGNDATPSSVAWSVSAGLDATVSGGSANENLVAGTKAGTGELTADAAGKIAKASVTITPGPAKSLEVPQKIEAVVGTTVDASARVLDEYGNEIATATASWTTASGLGTFSPSTGLSVKFIAGTKAGSAFFSVTSGTLTEVRELIVVPGPARRLEVPERIEAVAGTTVDASAKAFDEYGNEVPTATVGWATTSGLGTFSPATGLNVQFKAGPKAGNATFSVTSTGISVTGELLVVPGPPARIAVSPERVTLAPQGSAEVTATVFDQFENVIENATVTWEPPGFATLSSTTGERVSIRSEALGGAEGTLYARVGSVQASVPVKVDAFWTPDAFLRGGLSTMLFFLILLAIVGGIAGAAFVVRRRKRMNCPRCNSRNQRTSTLCSACGAPLHAGPTMPPLAPSQELSPGPMDPQYGGPPPQGWPPEGSGEAPPPPDDWQQGTSPPGGPEFAPPSQPEGPYQPPPP
ncbi:MAG TPA: S8 family serine peptidase, partial [Thermoplasmata archaeon]|nr:S8 family serine peptidase [Thermoplasmata archaeon]